MKLPLVEGGFTTVDKKDFDLLRHFRWHQCGFCKHIYRTIRRNLDDGDYTIYLAAEVMGKPLADVRGACNPCPAVRD